MFSMVNINCKASKTIVKIAKTKRFFSSPLFSFLKPEYTTWASKNEIPKTQTKELNIVLPSM